MASIELEGVAHRYGPDQGGAADWALDELSHRFEDGSAVALLGPSGCGKTTLLSLVSGLLRPTRGRVHLGGRDVTQCSPRERDVAQVFQFPVVYDTMTVFDNLAFPLRNRGVPEPEVRARVGEVAELLDLTARLAERARGLPPDAQQTVSLGRGLVRRDVAAILLDEPLTVIDPQQRRNIRRRLRLIHERSNVTLVYVTHDQTEALTFADEIVVMDRGRVLQVGTPRELFVNPTHAFVGHFIGSPGMNLLPCRIEGGMAVVGETRLPIPPQAAAAAAFRDPRDDVELGIRPDFLELLPNPAPGAAPVRVRSVGERGDHRLAAVALGDRILQVRVPEGAPIPAERAFLRFPPEWIRLYADGRLVA